MKKYQVIITICAIAILGFTAVRAEWSDPQSGEGSDTVYIPVNSSSALQIKTEGLAVGGTFLVTDNAQFDQGVFIPETATIFGGDPLYVTQGTPNNPSPRTIYFGGPNNEVGIEANGTFYVRNEITTPTLSNTTLKQVCADQYGYLSLCQ